MQSIEEFFQGCDEVRGFLKGNSANDDVVEIDALSSSKKTKTK